MKFTAPPLAFFFRPDLVKYSHIEAGEALEHRLLRPMNKNLVRSELALRNLTQQSQYSTTEAREALKRRLFRLQSSNSF